jgi:hypothetical protein
MICVDINRYYLFTRNDLQGNISVFVSIVISLLLIGFKINKISLRSQIQRRQQVLRYKIAIAEVGGRLDDHKSPALRSIKNAANLVANNNTHATASSSSAASMITPPATLTPLVVPSSPRGIGTKMHVPPAPEHGVLLPNGHHRRAHTASGGSYSTPTLMHHSDGSGNANGNGGTSHETSPLMGTAALSLHPRSPRSTIQPPSINTSTHDLLLSESQQPHHSSDDNSVIPPNVIGTPTRSLGVISTNNVITNTTLNNNSSSLAGGGGGHHRMRSVDRLPRPVSRRPSGGHATRIPSTGTPLPSVSTLQPIASSSSSSSTSGSTGASLTVSTSPHHANSLINTAQSSSPASNSTTGMPQFSFNRTPQTPLLPMHILNMRTQSTPIASSSSSTSTITTPRATNSTSSPHHEASNGRSAATLRKMMDASALSNDDLAV